MLNVIGESPVDTVALLDFNVKDLLRGTSSPPAVVNNGIAIALLDDEFIKVFDILAKGSVLIANCRSALKLYCVVLKFKKHAADTTTIDLFSPGASTNVKVGRAPARVKICADVNVLLIVIMSGAVDIAFILLTVAVFVELGVVDVSVNITKSPAFGVIVG